MIMYKFEELVSMRMSKQDKKLLEEKARLKRMTLSSFVRSVVMSSPQVKDNRDIF